MQQRKPRREHRKACENRSENECRGDAEGLSQETAEALGIGYLRQRTRLIVLGDTLYDRPNSRTDYPSAFRFRTSSC
jgi:hypothetical protein